MFSLDFMHIVNSLITLSSIQLPDMFKKKKKKKRKEKSDVATPHLLKTFQISIPIVSGLIFSTYFSNTLFFNLFRITFPPLAFIFNCIHSYLHLPIEPKHISVSYASFPLLEVKEARNIVIKIFLEIERC